MQNAYTQTTSAGLTNFVARSPQEIITEMYHLRQRVLLGENLELPLVTVVLWPDGTQVSGFITDIKADNQGNRFAMELSSHVAAGSNIFYGYMNAVSGVAIHNIDNYEHLLTEVTSSTRMNKPPRTTKLDVKKRLDTESKNISACVGATITYELSDDSSADTMMFFIAVNTITDVTICLRQIAATDIGKQTIASDIRKVKFVKSDKEFAVMKQDDELIIKTNFTRSFTTTQSRWKLRDMIEGVL